MWVAPRTLLPLILEAKGRNPERSSSLNCIHFGAYIFFTFKWGSKATVWRCWKRSMTFPQLNTKKLWKESLFLSPSLSVTQRMLWRCCQDRYIDVNVESSFIHSNYFVKQQETFVVLVHWWRWYGMVQTVHHQNDFSCKKLLIAGLWQWSII